MDQKKVIKMSGFPRETLLRILRIKLFALCLALIILQILFMVLIARSRGFIEALTSVHVAVFLVPGGILFLLPISGCFGGFFNNKIILWIFSGINAIITVVLIIVTCVYLNTDRRDKDDAILFLYMLGYMFCYYGIDEYKLKMDAIQMTGCCGIRSPSDWLSSKEGRYPNSCCGLLGIVFGGCGVDYVYKKGCLDRFKEFQNEMIACLCSYIVITFLLSIISGLIAFFSPRRERSVPPVVYSPPAYTAELIPVRTPLQVQMRPPLIQPMRRY